MSVAFVDPHQDAPDEQRVTEIDAALEHLPPEARRQLARALAEQEATGQPDPLIHFLESLRLTTAMLGDPEYVRGVARADAEDLTTPGVDLKDVLERALKRRKRRGE